MTRVVYPAHGVDEVFPQNIVHLTRVDIFDTPTVRATGSIDPFGPPPMTAVNLQANLTRNMVDGRINGVFTIRSKTGGLGSALYNRTTNASVFFRESSKNRQLQIIQQELNRHSNLPIKCPVTSTTYVIRNASLANARIPSLLPATHFRVDVNFLHGNPEKLILSKHWYGMCEEDNESTILSPVGNKITLQVNKKFGNATGTLRKNGAPSNQTVEIEFVVFRQIKSVKAAIAYYVVASNGAAQNALVTRTVDFCFYAQHPDSDRMVYIVYSHIRQLGNLPTRCPVEPGRYYFRNLRTSDLRFPGFLPESDFILECVLFSTTSLEVFAEFRYYGKMKRFTYYLR